LWHTNLVPELHKLHIPALGVYGTGDYVVNPKQADIMETNVPGAQVERFKGSRHFPMLDEPERFNQTLLAFLRR
jgi:pimeloyl-ACP methyl ester carboxylesterase